MLQLYGTEQTGGRQYKFRCRLDTFLESGSPFSKELGKLSNDAIRFCTELSSKSTLICFEAPEIKDKPRSSDTSTKSDDVQTGEYIYRSCICMMA